MTARERTRSNCSPSATRPASSRRSLESRKGATSTRPDRKSRHESPSARSTPAGLGLQVSLDLHAPNIAAEEAHELMLRADKRCPYSNATRGNITVALSVDGQPVAQAG